MFGDKGHDGKYFKVESGSEIAVIGEEVVGHATFDAGKRKMVSDRNGGFQFGVHVWDGERLALLQGGWRLYKAVGRVVKEHGENAVVRIEKSGSGLDTQFQAEYVRDLSNEEQEVIRECERFDLAQEFTWASDAGEEPGF